MGEMLSYNLTEIKKSFFKSKKFLIIYLVLTCVFFFSTFSENNIFHPKFELITFFCVVILGIICIIYYFAHDSSEELYKVAFVTILCFGIVCSLIVPICDVTDEWEHLTRAEITSEGIVFPYWTEHDGNISSNANINNDKPDVIYGFSTIEGVNDLHEYEGNTIFTTSHDSDKINQSEFVSNSAFEQNPFYGYLPQAIGIFIAKLLDLDLIWMLWLGRIFNILCYAGIISLAIKITPHLKIPLFAIACIPISIYQSASMSIDSMIIALGILTIAYFIFMCKSKEKSLGNKEILIFTLLCLLLGFCKLTYFAFIFLLLFIPKKNFVGNKKFYLILILIAITCFITLLWSNFTTNAWAHSWRSNLVNVNSTQQIEFLVNNPTGILNFLKASFSDEIPGLLKGFFNFHGVSQKYHYIDDYNLITLVLQLFLFFVLFAYPNKIKFDKITRIGSFLVFILIYIGTCFIQLLTWAHVGKTDMGICICIRYFIPLLALIPIVMGFNYNPKKDIKFDSYAMVLIISFMGALILSFATKYY